MRSDLSEKIARAVAQSRGPALIFDRDRIAANLAAIANAARSQRITVVMAAKSFAHPIVRELAAHVCCGFDVGSTGELDELGELARCELLSIADPSGLCDGRASRARRTIVSCDALDQVARASPAADIAIRVSASITGRDPAVGAVVDGTGHRRSRFGVTEAAEVAALLVAARGRRIGLHIHHGPVTATSPERFVAAAQAALALFPDPPAFINLGGAWHGITDFAATLATVRDRLADYELIIEPGRAIASGAGFAAGAVTVARALTDRAIAVCELSRICHLRWSSLELVGNASPNVRTLFVGPTCYEDDVLGEWYAPATAGQRIVWRGVTGYAVGWNHGFGGVPPATVMVV